MYPITLQGTNLVYFGANLVIVSSITNPNDYSETQFIMGAENKKLG
jgi:hypothetical protein